jgi:hypothetical protein
MMKILIDEPKMHAYEHVENLNELGIRLAVRF